MFILGTLMVAMSSEPGALIDPQWGRALFAVVVLAQFLPKLASALEVLLNRTLRRSFGGALHFILGVLIESLFSILILPVMWFEQTVFLMRLLAGRKSGWTAQIRANYSVPLSQAFRAFWMETLTGIILMGVLLYCAPGAWAYISYLLLGLVLSVPLTILSADPAVGRYFVRKGIAALPEEIAPPPAMIALNLPALNLPRDFRSSRIS
jgi:membrane glycosyltransferase